VAGELRNATRLWGMVEERIGNLTDNVDWSASSSLHLPQILIYRWELCPPPHPLSPQGR